MEKIWEWVMAEVAQIRRAPIAIILVFSLGCVAGAWALSWFHAERFALLNERIRSLNEAPLVVPQKMAQPVEPPEPQQPKAALQPDQPTTAPPTTIPNKSAKSSQPQVAEPPAVASTEPQPVVSTGPNSAVSIGQRGGITAGTLNIANPLWGLANGDLSRLTELIRLPPGTTQRSVSITCEFGESEACSFARVLDRVFQAAGWNGGKSGFAMVMVEPSYPEGVTAWAHRTDDLWLQRFVAVLSDAQIKVAGFGDSSMPESVDLGIRVGAKPR